jgi:hypothetical protein
VARRLTKLTRGRVFFLRPGSWVCGRPRGAAHGSLCGGRMLHLLPGPASSRGTGAAEGSRGGPTLQGASLAPIPAANGIPQSVPHSGRASRRGFALRTWQGEPADATGSRCGGRVLAVGGDRRGSRAANGSAQFGMRDGQLPDGTLAGLRSKHCEQEEERCGHFEPPADARSRAAVPPDRSDGTVRVRPFRRRSGP